jgi:predicted Zn finger-like uncharacterized protein
MIITCPNCDTNFKVQADVITADGRFVRCSNCNHEWLEQGDNTSLHLPSESPQLDAASTLTTNAQSELPSSEKVKPEQIPFLRRKHMRYLTPILAAKLVFIFMSLLAIYYHEQIIEKLPLTEQWYADLGIIDCPIKLEQASFIVHKEDMSMEDRTAKDMGVDVKVIVRNNSKSGQRLGTVSFIVYDTNKNFIDKVTMNYDKVIAPNNTMNIEGRLNGVPKNAGFVALDFANNTHVVAGNLNAIDRL